MTRTHVDRPVWAWKCDRCGRTAWSDLALDHSGLPSPDAMRERGWFIAEKFGDKCPWCVAETARPTAEVSR